MSEISRTTGSERNPEHHAARDAAEVLKQGITAHEAEHGIDWRLGIGICMIDGQWGVAIRVHAAENIPVAQYFAQAFIPGVPVDVQYVGSVRAQ